MTAFEDLTDEISVRLQGLPADAVTAIVVGWARAVLPDLAVLADKPAGADEMASRLCEQASEYLRSGAEAATIEEADIEAAQPAAESGGADFTAAQDAFSAAWLAWDSCRGRDVAGEAAWFMLEPTFQLESERLFGVTDVGSAEAEKEHDVLQQPRMVAAREAVDKVLAAAGQPVSSLADLAARELACLRTSDAK